MNLPNSITISRIATIPLLIWILSPAFPANPATHGLLGGEQELIASGVFILASITDGLDGYLARRRKQITTLGMLLDPLADKLMITAAYIILVAYTPNIVPPWIAVIIIGREFLVSGLRSIAASEGFTIEASEIGKLKTVIQIVSVVAAILAHRWNYWLWFPTPQGGGFVIAVHMIAMWAIYWMTIVSIISATDYFIGFWKKIDHAAERARTRRSSVLSRRKAKRAAAADRDPTRRTPHPHRLKRTLQSQPPEAASSRNPRSTQNPVSVSPARAPLPQAPQCGGQNPSPSRQTGWPASVATRHRPASRW
jgi:CDP-diacylglycerol--glycerol-3-phosphate 3-phosphatidyltransferase